MRHTTTKRLRRAGTVALALGTALALVSCSAGAPDDSEAPSDAGWLEELDPMTLRIADWTAGDATTGLYGQAWVDFGDRVTEATDGKITFEYFWGTSLLTAVDALPGVADGVADITVVNSVYYPSELPVGTWLSGLGAAGTGSIVHDIAANSAVALETAQTLEPLVAEWTANNVYPLMTVGSAPYNLLCTEPLDTLAAAEGKLVRTAGAPWTAVIEDLGMVPVNLSYNEIYEGLQRGVIDCVTINPNQLVSSLTVQDVAPNYHPVAFPLFQATNFVMTLDVWESFPLELKQLFTEEAATVAFDIWNKFIELESLAGDAILSGDIVNTVEARELQDAADKASAEFIAALPGSAPASVSNAEQVVQDYLDKLDKWNQVLIDQGYAMPSGDLESVLDMFRNLPDTDYTEFFEQFKSEYITPNAPR